MMEATTRFDDIVGLGFCGGVCGVCGAGANASAVSRRAARSITLNRMERKPVDDGMGSHLVHSITIRGRSFVS